MSDMDFKGPVEGYVTKFLLKQFWRVQRTMEWCDAMQEARWVFYDVRNRYPDVEDKHLMALFKTSWFNHFTDLATKDTRQRHIVHENMLVVGEDDEAAAASRTDRIGELDNEGVFSTLIAQAPREVELVLSLLLRAPQELLDLAVGAFSSKSPASRAAGSRRINKCLGLPDDYDSIGAVEDYLSP